MSTARNPVDLLALKAINNNVRMLRSGATDWAILVYRAKTVIFT